MSKYIQNRIQKIKELSDNLKSHNSYINNTIDLIQPLCDNDITISVFTNSIKNNKSICYNIFSLKFLINNNLFSYYSVRNEFSFGKENIPFKYLSFINNFLNKFNNIIDLEELFAHTQEAIKTFKEIETLQKEIDLKSSGFKEKSFLLINSIKENFPIQSNCNHDNGLFFNLKNNNSHKSISFQQVETIEQIKNGIYLKLPNLDKYELSKKISFDDINSRFNYLSNKSSIIRQDFFDLNKDFFNYIHLPIESISVELSILAPITPTISILDLKEEQISIAVDKIKLNTLISNF